MVEVDELIEKTLEETEYPVFEYRAITKDPTYIVYYIWSKKDVEFADDMAIMYEVRATVNVYTPKKDKPLINLITTKLDEAGFAIINNYGVYSSETGRIQTIIEIMYEGFYDGD